MPSTRTGLRVISALLIVISVLLAWQQYSIFQHETAVYPPGAAIGGVPVSGLTREEAGKAVEDAYNLPVELKYLDAVIQVQPSSLGFSINLEDTMRMADLIQADQRTLASFWNYLKDKSLPSFPQIEPQYSLDKAQTRLFLEDVALRYDRPPEMPLPVSAGADYSPGSPGYEMEIDATLSDIEKSLLSLANRSVSITVIQKQAPPPLIDNLKIQLQQIIDVNGFYGVAEIYLKDLQTGDTLHFARNDHQTIEPGIAFTAASAIKIPIMISTFARVGEPVPEDVMKYLQQMISVSENESADWLLQNVILENLGPLEITKDVQKLGLENTFLAGLFYMGAPLLQRFETSANQRSDVNLQPDIFNQTTPAEIGTLLEAIYQCSEDGSGLLIDKFDGQITQGECAQMVELLKSDKLPYLITAGLPEGTPIGHKHGWIEEADGLLHTMSDSALIYSPKGDYILCVYLYHPVNLVFDSGNYLIAQLSRAVWNYFEIHQP